MNIIHNLKKFKLIFNNVFDFLIREAPIPTTEPLDVPDPVEGSDPREEQEDFTTTGFLKKKFTQGMFKVFTICVPFFFTLLDYFPNGAT